MIKAVLNTELLARNDKTSGTIQFISRPEKFVVPSIFRKTVFLGSSTACYYWNMSKPVLIKFGILLLIGGGLILWNAWVLGFLNHGAAGYTQMSISELNVSGQPFAQLFTATEWLSGLLLLIGGLVLTAMKPRSRFMLIALLLIAAIGGLTIFDATHPLDCNRYQNQICQIEWARGEVTITHKEHGIESRITDYATMLLAITLLAWALHHTFSKKNVPYIELAIVAVLAIAIVLPLIISSNSIVIESLGQRLWNTVTSLAFLYIAYKVRQTMNEPANYSQRKSLKAIA
jgi:hypothetical protein